MGSINKSHNETDGGILLYNGELILLYCDSVSCEIGGKETVRGRVYLTTHRMVLLVIPYKPNSAVKSLCAPFCAITKINLEQPIFGANYIEATVSDEADPSKTFSFKLKFSKGGAVEFAMAMNRAVSAVGRINANSSFRPTTYTPSPTDSYYQAPPTVYAPGYNCGVQMPVHQFPDQPPIGFIYTSSAPPPYPGLSSNQPPPSTIVSGGPPPPYNTADQHQTGYPGQQAGWPGQQSTGYPDQQSTGYPGQQSTGYPGQQSTGYPGQQSTGYTAGQQQTGYPSQQQPGPQQIDTNTPIGFQPGSIYPNPSATTGEAGQQQSNWSNTPAFNPNWEQNRKS